MSTRSARSPSSHTGRVAVVTGAAGGFGHAIAGELARRGADIIAVDLDPADRTVETVQEIGRQAVQFQADLSGQEQVAALAPELLGFAGRVDVLVNNAGAFPFKGWGRIVNLASNSLGLAVPRHGPLHGRQGRGRRLHPRPRPVRLHRQRHLPDRVAHPGRPALHRGTTCCARWPTADSSGSDPAQTA
ncbi:SDR family NAD(P)-dependent oxidoreductase [Streptomyces sp. NPDC056296]|uniref:SDR family NAD(P)-dependent oxidoreductase n=1 Tax=Streptomyces sp. NPDC056296 TaxID=3345775 RepID=UPI0035DA1A8E